MEKIAVRSFRDLLVWQKSMLLVTEIYNVTRSFPREEMYVLTSQIRRCAISIPSNIAEGYGRNSTGDYVRFLRVAAGSLLELQTQLEISANLKYLPHDLFKNIFSKVREIELMLQSLINKIN